MQCDYALVSRLVAILQAHILSSAEPPYLAQSTKAQIPKN